MRPAFRSSRRFAPRAQTLAQFTKARGSRQCLYSTKASTKSSGGSSWTQGWRKWGLTLGFVGAGYGVGSWNFDHFGPKRTQQEIDEELDTISEYSYIHHHPYVQHLREENAVTQRWREGRYYDNIPLLHRGHMLTSGLLRGPGYLTVEPIWFQDKKAGEIVVFYHVGDKLDGHDGIVHGGFLATLMDEGLTRCGFPLLPNKYGVTGTLELNYRAPTPADSYLVLHGKVESVNGRRVVTKGRLCLLPSYEEAGKTAAGSLEGRVLVEGEALLVEPKWAKYFLWMI